MKWISDVIDQALDTVGMGLETALGFFCPSPAEARAKAIAKFDEQQRDAELAECGPADMGSAGSGTGTLSDGSSLRRPSPGTPVTVDQVHRLRLVIEVHYLSVVSTHGYGKCRCGWVGPIAAHADHIADVACEHLADDTRKAFVTNKFRH